jgi:hypothetical protein
MELPADTAEIGATSPSEAVATGRKVQLLTLGALDGRTAAAKNVRALIADIEDDLGGPDRLSAAEREITQRAALASAVLQDLEAHWLTGRPLDIASYTTLANSQARLLKMLGLQRRPRDVTPSLTDYVASRATEAPAHTPAAPVAPQPHPVPAQPVPTLVPPPAAPIVSGGISSTPPETFPPPPLTPLPAPGDDECEAP